MIQDRYGFQHRATRGGIAAFEEATHAVLAYHPTGADALARALAQDEGHIAAHAVLGISLVLQARADLIGRARQSAVAAHQWADDGATEHERCLLDTLDLALDGHLAAAAARLEQRGAGGAPAEASGAAAPPLKVKLANMLRFQLGDVTGMARGTAAALAVLDPQAPGYSHTLGCHAFALEELGDYATAERLGRQALSIDPDDVWSIHAVAHTFEMRGMAADGVAWLEAQRPIWQQRGSFGFHAAWHLALFHLERGAFDQVLALYDTDIRPRPTPDVRDIANGVGMLCRLRQAGVPVGDRWNELAEIARARVQDTSVLFFTLHYLLALLAVGDDAAAAALVAAIDHEAAGNRDQSAVARQIGQGLAHAMLNLSRQAGGRQRLDDLARGLRPLGGSAAQRDLFVRSLAEGALATGDTVSVAAILAARRALRPVDRFDRMMQQEIQDQCVPA